MYKLYRMKADELNIQFLETLKAMFQNKEIEIAVCEAGENDEDETAYLLRSPANRDRLLKALDNVAQQRNLVTVELNELQP
jgi:antitoxin YefM